MEMNDTAFTFTTVATGDTANEADTENELDIALIVFRLLVCVIGVIGNALVIFVILILREYKKAVTHWYVLQLAIADSIFLLTIPFKVSEEINNEWIYSAGMCKAKETVLFLNYYSSIIFLMIMSIDRYIAICHGFSDTLQKLRTPRAAFIITVVAWIVSLVMCTPIIMYSNKMGIEPNCKCRYLIPKPAKTPEEICAEEGFEGSSFDLCLTWQSPASEKNLCSSLGEIGALGGGMEVGAYDSLLLGIDGETSGMIFPGGEDESTTNINQEVGGSSHILAMDCHYLNHGSAWTAMLTFNFTAMFLAPLIVMTICYVLIVFRLTKTRNRTNSTNVPSHVSVTSTVGNTTGSGRNKRRRSTATSKADRNRNRVTIMCACLVSLFLVCWLPFHAVHIAKLVGISGKTSEYCMKISAVASLIAYVNSALNPYLYNFLGTRFGRRLRSAASSVRESVKKTTSSVSSSGAVRYQPKKQLGDGGSSSQNGTVVTKIYKGQEINTAEMSSANDVFPEDSKNPEEQERLFSNNQA